MRERRLRGGRVEAYHYHRPGIRGRGRSVAKRISDLLGIPHYDKEIIQLAAEKTGISEEMIRGTEEHESGKTLLNWFLPSGSASAYDQAILAQAQTIRKIAEQGPCVIVGRGGGLYPPGFSPPGQCLPVCGKEGQGPLCHGDLRGKL